MNKILVTHINPHLDDISAIWLYKKFHPEFSDAEIEFIPASRTAGQDESADKIYLGTGGGKFDEHKGDLEDAAISLVWKDIKNNGLAPKNETEFKSYEELVNWSRDIDLGKGTDQDFGTYSIQSFIRSKDNSTESSLNSLKMGEEILDRVLTLLKEQHKSDQDWQKRQEFNSKFGATVAVKSQTIDRSFCRQKAGDLFLMYDPEKKSAQFFTPKEIDLEPIYKKAIELEPNNGWFLHQSHHMVICGSSSAPDAHTDLYFDQLVELTK